MTMARFGPCSGRIETPLFLADTGILVDRYLGLHRTLERLWGPFAIAYSFKTNYAVAESRILAGEGRLGGGGVGARVPTGEEARLRGKEIVFNGPYKRDDELRNALRDGALIHVNDRPELERLLALLPPRPTGVRIGLRVDAGPPAVGPSRFGLSLARGEAQAAVARIASVDGLELAGFHLHLKGDTDDPDPYREAARELARFIAEVTPRLGGNRVASLDLGGGFPAHGPKPRSRVHWAPPADRGVRAGDHRRAGGSVSEERAPDADPRAGALSRRGRDRLRVGDRARGSATPGSSSSRATELSRCFR